MCGRERYRARERDEGWKKGRRERKIDREIERMDRGERQREIGGGGSERERIMKEKYR